MRKPGRFVTMACFGLMAACGPTTPSSATLEGQWSGTTIQGTTFSFTVSQDEKVIAITVGYSFNSCSGTQTFSNLNLETVPSLTCIPGPCTGSLASYRAFNYSTARSIDGPSTTVNGIFPSANRAEGQVTFRDYPGCGTATSAGWAATKR